MLHQDRRRVARDRIVDAEVMKLELRNARLRVRATRAVTEARPHTRVEPYRPPKTT